MPVKSQKRRIHSSLLGRGAHADLFETGAEPRFLVILFGGSGIDAEEYERRSNSVIPVFNETLESVADDVSLVMAYVTAPFDVPFIRFSSEAAAANLWTAHVLGELLEPWSSFPYLVSGFSGGAALALNGLHQEPRCFAGAALGADAIPPEFTCPSHWVEKLRLYAAPHDRVCNHPVNRRIIESLRSRGEAKEVRLPSGGHRLADYATDECLGELIRRADRITPT